MSTYTAQTPSSNGTTVPPSIIKYYEKFYKISDDPSDQAHADYVQLFTKDATMIMGARGATGSDALFEFRKGLWAGPVKSRLHTLEKIFPWEKNSNEVMLFGKVLFGLKNGKEGTIDWAARATLEGVGQGDENADAVKMSFYQVYLDTSPLAELLKD